MRKWIAVPLLLCWASVAEAQLSHEELEDISSKMITDMVHDHKMMGVSGGCSGYSFGTTPYTWLTPSEEAALGNVTATFTEKAELTGALSSHEITVTPGTRIDWTWASNNGVSAVYYESKDGATPSGPFTASLNASFYAWTMAQADVGHNWVITFAVTDQSGNMTQDQIKITVVAGSSPTIVHQDNMPYNMYLRINPNFGGGSMDATCQICSQQPSACSGAQHTPYISGSMKDNTNGQTLTVPKQVAGSVVNETSPISGSAFWDMSTMPSEVGDIGANATGEIFCSAVEDDIYDSLLTMRIEYAKVVVKDLGHPGRPGADGSTIYDVAPICDNNSDPSDWQPTVVHSFSGRHTYWWGVTSLFRAPDLQGMRWIALANFLVDWSPQSQPWALAKMVIEGGAVPYPGGTAPDFPIPGACTQYPKNVLLTLGIQARNFPFWPFNTGN